MTEQLTAEKVFAWTKPSITGSRLFWEGEERPKGFGDWKPLYMRTAEPEGVVKAARRLVERIYGCAVSNPLTNTDILWYTRLLREELANCSAPTKGEGL